MKCAIILMWSSYDVHLLLKTTCLFVLTRSIARSSALKLNCNKFVDILALEMPKSSSFMSNYRRFSLLFVRMKTHRAFISGFFSANSAHRTTRTACSSIGLSKVITALTGNKIKTKLLCMRVQLNNRSNTDYLKIFTTQQKLSLMSFFFQRLQCFPF